METVFRKVEVKERLPQDGQKHIFHLKESVNSADEGVKNFDEAYTIHPEQIKEVKRTCDWWLEEVKIPDPQELWDEYSQHIDHDLDSLQIVAGNTVMLKGTFLRMYVEKLFL